MYLIMVTMKNLEMKMLAFFINENVSVNTGPWEREGFSTIRKKFNLLPSTIAKVWITP